jgi:guanylate kinase
VTVLVLPPSIEELERRLRGRSTDAAEVIARRLAAARSEVAEGLARYDYAVVNDVLADAEASLDAIVAYERARVGGTDDRAGAASLERLRAGHLDARPWLLS